MNWADIKTLKTAEIISYFIDQIQYLTCLKIGSYFNTFVYISGKSANIVKIHSIRNHRIKYSVKILTAYSLTLAQQTKQYLEWFYWFLHLTDKKHPNLLKQ